MTNIVDSTGMTEAEIIALRDKVKNGILPTITSAYSGIQTTQLPVVVNALASGLTCQQICAAQNVGNPIGYAACVAATCRTLAKEQDHDHGGDTKWEDKDPLWFFVEKGLDPNTVVPAPLLDQPVIASAQAKVSTSPSNYPTDNPADGAITPIPVPVS